MKHTVFGKILSFVLLAYTGAIATLAMAEDSLVPVEVRPGIVLTVHLMHHLDQSATGIVALLPGGGGGLNLDANGVPRNQNFLIRARGLFYDAGYDVVSISNPSDHPDLSAQYRSSNEHLSDMETVVKFMKAKANLPVWLIGTSRGTTSAAASAVKFGNQLLAGLVFSSSVSTGRNGGAVQNEDLEQIRIPVLVVHHENDECKATPLSGAETILRHLKNTPIKQLITECGGSASGSECGPFHHHGYEGIEEKTVKAITDWMAHPVSQ